MNLLLGEIIFIFLSVRNIYDVMCLLGCHLGLISSQSESKCIRKEVNIFCMFNSFPIYFESTFTPTVTKVEIMLP